MIRHPKYCQAECKKNPLSLESQSVKAGVRSVLPTSFFLNVNLVDYSKCFYMLPKDGLGDGGG